MAQLGPAIASFVATGGSTLGPRQLVVRLDPADLGLVQVRIEHSPDRPARVDLVVERPDTLLLLLRDQPQLQRALDLAGVPAADRVVQFHLVPPEGSADAQGAGQRFDQPPEPERRRTTPGGDRGGVAEDPLPGTAPTPAWRRAGVDITA